MSMEIPHTRILASAGSGKTYALTNRFIKLLMAGEDPERILAMTFTRMAAGEFFDAILTKLAAAASDPEQGRSLARELDLDDENPDWVRPLIAVLRNMGKLRLGTLDGFFHEILNGFSLEFGIGPGFQLLEAADAELERKQLFRVFFQRKGVGPEDRKLFAEAFKQATFGEDQKSLVKDLERYIDNQHNIYLAEPRADRWGNRRRIWPEDGGPWQESLDRHRAVREVKRALDPQLKAGRVKDGWWSFLDRAESWEPGMDFGGTILTKIEAARPDLERGAAEVAYYSKKVSLEGEPARQLIHLVDTLYHLELERRIQRTRGIRTVMAAYESLYSRLVRRQGKLTFQDIQLLLAGTLGDGAPALTQDSDAEATRLDIHFRLDGRFDHWLLDEFQDTSRLQWAVLQDLVDEVVMDPEGRRTLFYVGDVKQAIYGWRGGDAALFDAVTRRYADGDGRSPIEKKELQKSWRSGPSIIDLVNEVFGSREVLRGVFNRSPAAVENWATIWREHTTAHADRADFAAHLRVDDKEERFTAVHTLITRMQPHRRGLTCALLVQTNDQVKDWVRILRNRGGIPVLEERDLSIATDNPLGALIRSLIQSAAHPGDRYAWEHLLMSPLGDLLDGEEWGYARFQRHVQRLAAAGGFAAVLEFWIQKIRERTALDAFNTLRAEQLLEAAEHFDAGGRHDPDAFLVFLDGYRVRPGDSAGGVRVMTVHQSKGLGFDVVVLPELGRRGTRSLDQPRDELGIARDGEGAIQWILDLPKSDLMEADATLGAFRQGQRNETAYESLCLLYVALTRAVRGLYLVTEPGPKNPGTPDYVAWLDAALDAEDATDDTAPDPVDEVPCKWSRGDPRWFEEHPLDATTTAPTPSGPEAYPERPAEPELVRPSRAGGDMPWPSLSAAGRMESGDWVHRAFEQVGWLDSRTPDALREWADQLPEDRRALARSGVQTVLACLEIPKIRQCFTVPDDTGAELFREQPFDWIDGNRRVTGQWDRLQVHPGPPRRALLIDFKGGNPAEPVPSADDALERYGEQMRHYRDAAAAGTGLHPRAVEMCILFYNHQSLLSLPLPDPS